MKLAQPSISDMFIACLRAGGNLRFGEWRAWQFGEQYILKAQSGKAFRHESEVTFIDACISVAPLAVWRISSYTPQDAQKTAHAALKTACPRMFQLQVQP